LKQPVRIAVVDDHQLFREGIINMLQKYSSKYQVVAQASNGKEFLEILPRVQPVHVLLLDIEMPVMNGFETAGVVRKNYPDVNVVVITGNDNELSIIRMLQHGVKAFLSKDINTEELIKAVDVSAKGDIYLASASASGKISNQSKPLAKGLLTDKEIQIIKYCCTDITYREMAEIMKLSPKTIDNYRASIFDKLQVKNRVGIALYAVKHGIVKL
jgi:DNA-binding NarL/FixJ family response regulator